MVGVDGTALTLAHEDGLPKWVATTDAAMQMLEEVQHDFGEGPCLLAYAEDRVVAVEDLRRELVWIEQAKGTVAATEGITLDEAFRQLRMRARASSRKLAAVAQEVVQEAQRERVAAKALDDARVRAAEARAGEAEQDLQEAQTGLARHEAALDRSQDVLDARERAADKRERDWAAAQRDRAADDPTSKEGRRLPRAVSDARNAF